MKKLLTSLSISALLFTGCALLQSNTPYKTLYTIEHTTSDAYDAYLDTVTKGSSSTNAVPSVSTKFNLFQASYLIALDAAQYNTNALAPSSLVQESSDVIDLINTVKGKK